MAWSGIHPADRAVWWAEIIPIFLVFGALVLSYPLFRFSNPAYALMIQHLLGHRYGSLFQRLQSHYTSDDMPHRSEDEHRTLLHALEQHDAQGARQAMADHLDEVIRIFSRNAQ